MLDSVYKRNMFDIANPVGLVRNMSETLEKQQRWKEQKDEADRQRMGGAYIQGFIQTAAALVGEEPLFSKGYWKCAGGCKPFGFGLARTPRECPSCHKQLILWVPGP